MFADEVRTKSDADIRQDLDDAYRELMNLRFRWATRQLTSVHEIRKVQKDIARMHTILRERELGIVNG